MVACKDTSTTTRTVSIGCRLGAGPALCLRMTRSSRPAASRSATPSIKSTIRRSSTARRTRRSILYVSHAASLRALALARALLTVGDVGLGRQQRLDLRRRQGVVLVHLRTARHLVHLAARPDHSLGPGVVRRLHGTGTVCVPEPGLAQERINLARRSRRVSSERLFGSCWAWEVWVVVWSGGPRS